jgi:NADH:ubiquinone reductase (H+-translocating)
MAMIRRDSAVAAIGKKNRNSTGPCFRRVAGVHALLKSGVRVRIEAFIDWASEYFSRSLPIQVWDRSDERRINGDEGAGSGDSSLSPAG